MSVEAATPGSDGASGLIDNSDRAALEGMLKAYPTEQLVDEVLIAWEELSERNKELADAKQKLRVVELDLAEREDGVAPEIARLSEAEQMLQEKDARVVHLERMLEDARSELEALAASMTAEEREAMKAENAQLRELTIEQADVVAELEAKMDQLVAALDKAAQAGLTSITADEVRGLKGQLDQREEDLAAEIAAREALEEERQRLREIADRLRGLLDQRDRRLGELEEQLERVMTGPRSVSAEHDYLVEQIEELKRRLLERNREYEALRRRERRLHNDVFERDERVQQMHLTITDLEAALQDRTSELKEVESQRERAMLELDAARRSEKTREVVGRVFQDSLGLVRDHSAREETRARIVEEGPKKRTIESPSLDDMHTLAGGDEIDLEKNVESLPQGDEPDTRPNAPGGSGDPVVYEDDD
ncbi:MAG: hypothetical protein CMB49_03135 [Euryarchaeota archaeon]|nr:hypothetical protein [Euryarchaeota archaeon]